MKKKNNTHLNIAIKERVNKQKQNKVYNEQMERGSKKKKKNNLPFQMSFCLHNF